ncbi:MAG TPA: hypothetical protein VNR00_16570 [Opitutus sp.]|nr:hypothetical protein [Opitutus sp.]
MNLPAKLLGLLMLGASAVAYFRFRRGLTRGYTGPRRRPIRYETSPWRFKFALASHLLALLICLIGAALCLGHGFRH